MRGGDNTLLLAFAAAPHPSLFLVKDGEGGKFCSYREIGTP